MKSPRTTKLLALLTTSVTAVSHRPTLSNLLGTLPTLPAHERILSQPVFQVTTPWGSPYMLFEKYKDEEKAIESSPNNANDSDAAETEDDATKFSRVQQKDDMQDTRPISLYFLDEHDARALADEMKQMKHMKDGDLRITCTTLGKAVRSSARLGRGMPTGQPMEDTTGKLPGMDEGEAYGIRLSPRSGNCFMPRDPPDVIEGAKMAVRRKAGANRRGRVQRARQAEKEGVVESEENRLRREYGHMEGQVGLPVFYAEGLVKRPPLMRRLVQGSRAWSTSSLIPLYFSYQDLLHDWSVMREKCVENKAGVPERPPQIEVFNMLDVVTSIDKEQWKKERRSELLREKKGWIGKIPIVHHLVGGKKSSSAVKSGLERVVFVPSSLGVQAKERISAAGNRKARLRPMRAWGRNA
ncbi:hypothetical protein HJC23_010694 [Cyclotella cryptica]|uniref:Tic22-like protein n=1 Tax=Cyclotella cryptica TaxID=29204 RepID=A0ABD3P8P9_9STRA